MKGTALITGASSGLGHDYASLFAADGHDVILVARRLDRLETLAGELRAQHGVDARALPADLAREGAATELVGEIERLGLRVDFLVNNAGFGTTGAFADSDRTGQLDMIRVNVGSVVELTHLLLPAMVERGRGRILNVGSTAGFQPGPFMATYYATKAFVNSFTEALAWELAGTGVTATVSCPGATATEFGGKAGNGDSLLFRLGAADSRVVAREGYRAMMSGTRMVVHGITNKVAVQSVRLSPRAAILAIASRLNRS